MNSIRFFLGSLSTYRLYGLILTLPTITTACLDSGVSRAPESEAGAPIDEAVSTPEAPDAACRQRRDLQPDAPERGESQVAWVGNITQGGVLPSDFDSFWDQLTPENEAKWSAVEPSRDAMDWSRLDEYYEYTRTHGFPLKAHTFVWGKQEPSWVATLDPEEQAQEVEEWIQLYCERYPETELIDVVNEPVHEKPSYLDALGGGDGTTWQWVIRAFEMAREHCPNATLILNDYNVLAWDTAGFLSVARALSAQGLVDGLGAQAHGLERLPMSQLERGLTEVAALGLPIYISEYDLDIADDDCQKLVLQNQFPLFYHHPAVVGITLWGYEYGRHWKRNAYLLNEDGSPRPALSWLVDFLER